MRVGPIGGRRSASALAALAVGAGLACGDGGAPSGPLLSSASAAAACPTVLVPVRATHLVWVARTRKVHGRRVVVRRHGKVVHIRVLASYVKLEPRILCPPEASAPLQVSPTPATGQSASSSSNPTPNPLPPPASTAVTPPANASPPTLTGGAVVGQTLSAGTGSWSESPTSYAYRWERCNSLGSGCAALSAATGAPTYLLSSEDVGHTIRVAVTASNAAGPSIPADSPPSEAVRAQHSVEHLEYVLEDGLVSVYSMDEGQKLVKTIELPQTNAGVRGVMAAPSTHRLFISYGGDGGPFGNGSVLAYDLVSEKVLWTVHLSTGIDSGAVSPDGQRLYMPAGENSASGTWNVLNTADGSLLGTIQGGWAPHNTIASADGRYVYLGGRQSEYLEVYETGTASVRGIGPLKGTVRPFTVNGSNTLAFITLTGFDGFQVGSITTGKVLFTVDLGPLPAGFQFTTASHGISLSPDEREIYVLDAVNKEVRVFDVARVREGVAPIELAAIPVDGLSGEESNCFYDCGRGGWLQHSLDGRFVYVGDSGDVIETATRKVIARLTPLLNTKKTIEVDWANGLPVATSTRSGVGYVE